MGKKNPKHLHQDGHLNSTWVNIQTEMTKTKQLFKHFFLHRSVSRLSEAALNQNCFGCLHQAYCPAGWTYSVILTAAERLLITPIQTVVVSITLPQSPDAALIMALELVLSAWLRFWTATRGFCKRQETYEISVSGRIISITIIALKLIIMSLDPVDDCWDWAYIS